MTWTPRQYDPAGYEPRGYAPDNATRVELVADGDTLATSFEGEQATVQGDPGSDRQLTAVAFNRCGLSAPGDAPEAVRLAFDGLGDLELPAADPAEDLALTATAGGGVRATWTYRPTPGLPTAASWRVQVSAQGSTATQTIPAAGRRLSLALGPFAHGVLVAVVVRSQTAFDSLSGPAQASIEADALAPSAVQIVAVTARDGLAA